MGIIFTISWFAVLKELDAFFRVEYWTVIE